MRDLSWEELLNLFLAYREGDSDSVRLLFDSLSKCMKKFCQFKGAKGDPEDLSQQILLKIHLSRDSYETQQNFKTWIYTIAQNTLIDLWRKHKEELFLNEEDQDESFNSIIDESISPYKKAEIKNQLNEILKQLNPTDQRLIYLYGYEELSTKELSLVTGLSESAVKVKIHRILKNIRTPS